MDRQAIVGRSSHHRLAGDREPGPARWVRAVGHDYVKLRAVALPDMAVIGGAQARRVPGERLKYSPEIGRGFADDPQDLSGRGLAPTRLRQLCLKLPNLPAK